MKTVLFCPGFRESKTNRDYKSVIEAIESKGYRVRFIPINWDKTIIDDWVAQLEKVYINYDPKETILAGFSFGSMTALVTATNRMPSELWLFSLSPYFFEDLHLIKPAYLFDIGKKRTERFKNLFFNKLAPRITCKTLIFVGAKEATKYPEIGLRAHDAVKKLKNSQLYTIPNVGHDVADKQYINQIKSVI